MTNLYTLERKLKRNGFKFHANTDGTYIKIGSARPSYGFLFVWLVLPMLAIMAVLLLTYFWAINFNNTGPDQFIDYLFLAVGLFVLGIFLSYQRFSLNRASVEIRPDRLIITANGATHIVKEEDIKSIIIDDKKRYKFENALWQFRGNLTITTANEEKFNVIYLFGSNRMNVWDDLYYLKNHMCAILNVADE
ncbi:MAG: hypothetical protein ABJH05_07590 [Fulvivirga sp.]